MTPVPRLADVLGTAVRVGDLRIGTVTGVFGDGEFTRVLGLEVTSPERDCRFLPWVTATVRGSAVRLDSALVLAETGELDSYVRRGAIVVRDFMRLSGLAVDSGGRVEHREAGGVSLRPATGTSMA